MGFYRTRLLPWLMEKFLGRPEIGVLRRAALREARGTVLEIGFGFGATISEYPSQPGQIRLVVGLEPNPGMVARALPHAAVAAFPVRLVRGSSSALPFAAAAFDTIATNFTLCSLVDLAPSLAEIRRVLKPGGRYLFLEHGLAQEPRLARSQAFLAPCCRLFGDGCRVNLPIDVVIGAAGLSIDRLERFDGPLGPRFARQMYRGAARP